MNAIIQIGIEKNRKKKEKKEDLYVTCKKLCPGVRVVEKIFKRRLWMRNRSVVKRGWGKVKEERQGGGVIHW